MNLTSLEKAIVSMCRYNSETPTLTRIDKNFNIGHVKCEITWKTSANLWGRFGGGWNWQIGAQWSKTTIIIKLLVMSVRLSIYDYVKAKNEEEKF